MKEIYGVRPLNKGNYHTLHYENLIKNIMKTREEFRLIPYNSIMILY